MRVKYRAVVQDHTQDSRPVQVFGQDLPALERWGGMMREKLGKNVAIYERLERLVMVLNIPDPPDSQVVPRPCEYCHETLRKCSDRSTCPGCGMVLR